MELFVQLLKAYHVYISLYCPQVAKKLMLLLNHIIYYILCKTLVSAGEVM